MKYLLDEHSKIVKSIFFWAFLFLTLAIRFTAVYPPRPCVDVAAYAIQGWNVLQGEYPLFYYGQTFMGTGGAFLIALFFKILGVSYTTLHIIGWFMSSLAITCSVLLARRLFNYSIAFFLLLYFLFPTPAQLQRSIEARPDYALSFIFVPMILAFTYKIITSSLKNNKLISLGIFSGFALYNNLLTSTLVLTSWIFIFIMKRKELSLKNLFAYSLSFSIGFLPEIYANCRMDFFIFKMSSLDNFSMLPLKIKNFVLIAFPFFYGFEKEAIKQEYSFFQIIFLIWIVFLFIHFLKLTFTEKGQKVIALRLIAFYCFFHLFISLITFFGRRFEVLYNPVSYIDILCYPVAFLIPAASWYFLKLRKIYKLLLLAPFLIFLGNNFMNFKLSVNESLSYYKKTEKRDPAKIYPDDNFFNILNSNSLKYGYFDGAGKNHFVLRYRNSVTLANSYEEVYLPAAINVDAARNIFWAGRSYTDLDRFFNSLMVNYESVSTKDYYNQNIYYNFEKKQYVQTELIRNFKIKASCFNEDICYLTDNLKQTNWSTRDVQSAGDNLIFDFAAPEDIYKIEIILEDYKSGPNNFKVSALTEEGGNDDLFKFTDHPGMGCFSVFHPFIKIVKPRLELIVNKEKIKSLKLEIGATGRFPLSISEIYLHKKIKSYPKKDYELFINKLIRDIVEKDIKFNIIADYWFSAYFYQQGFSVDLIPNRFINNYGIENKHLERTSPVLFNKKPSLIIVESAYMANTKKILKKYDINHTISNHGNFALFNIPVQAKKADCYWNGVTLMDSISLKGGVSLEEITDNSLQTDLNFEENFFINAYALNKENKYYELMFESSINHLTDNRYFMFIHFCDAAGKILYQGDFLIESSDGTTDKWQDQRKYILKKRIDIPEGSAADNIHLGIWDSSAKRALFLNKSKKQTFYTIQLK